MDDAGIVRRLTTILAADVVGYSKLMAANEEATLARLRTYLQVIDNLITKHDGRIFNKAGDAVLAEFGSAVEAVRCAVSIQEDLAARNAQFDPDEQMWFRIGINVGDVMIEGNDLFGDGVNVAARLEGLAEKGGICISGGTFEQVKNKVSLAFKDIGPQTLKNIPEAVSAFRVVPGEVSVRAGGHDPGLKANKPDQRRRRLPLLPAVAVILAVLSIGIFYFYHMVRSVESGYPFDGDWQVSVYSRSGCLSNDDVGYPVHVTKGLINEPTQRLPKKGSITDDGKFLIEVSNRDGRPMNTQSGKINGDKGEGKFIGAKPSCNGLVSIERVN